MIIKCFRCGTELNTPDDKNADYVIASDMISIEKRGIIIALKNTQETKDKKAQKLPITDDDYKKVIIPNFEASLAIPELEKVIISAEDIPIQKSAIICPNCYLPSDFVIWGVHK